MRPLDVAAGSPTSLAHVDVVIPVHSEDRPILRAVGSVLADPEIGVRACVVCHNVGADRIRAALGSVADDPRVALLEYADGTASAAGPVNFGLANATGAWVMRLDSDDELEPGALRGMLATAERTRSDVVIPLLVRDDGVAPSPRPRPGRVTRLDPVRDRLAYRTHSFALTRREALGDLRMTEGVRSGEDLEFATRLWFSAPRIALHLGPGYRLNGDASDRVTRARRTVAEDVEAVLRLVGGDWWAGLPGVARRSIGTKLLRNHVFPLFLSRPTPDDWSTDDVSALRSATRAVLDAAPGADRPLSMTEAGLLRIALSAEPDVAAAHRLARRPKRLVEIWTTGRRSALLARDAPVRMNLSARALARAAARSRRA
ncbi:MAG TPA: glycosyltransferase family 2 protein [Agromyces sp.]|nr:glycosyltransferase family 2 protein [Agromyces sp.]